MSFDKNKYDNQYVREHYIRKEIRFKPEDWKQLDEKLKENNKTIKDVLFDFANIKLKKEETDN